MSEHDLRAGIDAESVAAAPVAGKVDGEDVVLVRLGGRICALSGSCTHLGAPLADGIVANGELRCPWHHARFSVETGEAVGAPAFEPLDRYDVIEEGGRVRVTGKRAPVANAPGKAPTIGRVLIVGGGAAGHACADMLARAGAGSSVTLLSDDADAPYDRTQCSKQYLAGEAERDALPLPAPGLGRGAGTTMRTGTTVKRLDLAGKMVELDGGERVAFDTLVLATGAEPVVPDFEGCDRDDLFVMRTLADADRLIAAARRASKALILGSSYIGLEVAASLVQRGLSVVVAAEGDVPLEKTTGPEIGGLVRSLHEDKGVTFRMGTTIEAWNGARATLDDGTTIDADLLVVGTGVAPRLELAKAAGLAIADEKAGGGIVVDATLRTSAPGVYAIGDIASVPDPRLGHPIRVEHWVVAQRMGQWLARHLLGTADGDYADLPFFWSGHYDSNLRYIGHVASTDERRIDGDVAAKDVAVIFAEAGEDRALLTCGRDAQSLETEAAWER